MVRGTTGLYTRFLYRPLYNGLFYNPKLLIPLSLAPRHGFEPRFTAPKAAVLPLDDRGKSALQEEVLLQCSVALRAAATICYHRSWKLILAGAGRGLQTRRAVLSCRMWVRLPLASAKFQDRARPLQYPVDRAVP